MRKEFFYIQFQIFDTFRVFVLSHKGKDSLRQQKSLGAAVSFLLCSIVLLPCPASSSTAHPLKPGLMKTLETEDLHSSESCTVPMFWIPVLIIPGMAEGREVFLSASLMFQSNTTKSIPTLYSFPNPSMPGLSLHIKCSLQILPSQKIT